MKGLDKLRQQAKESFATFFEELPSMRSRPTAEAQYEGACQRLKEIQDAFFEEAARHLQPYIDNFVSTYQPTNYGEDSIVTDILESRLHGLGLGLFSNGKPAILNAERAQGENGLDPTEAKSSFVALTISTKPPLYYQRGEPTHNIPKLQLGRYTLDNQLWTRRVHGHGDGFQR